MYIYIYIHMCESINTHTHYLYIYLFHGSTPAASPPFAYGGDDVDHPCLLHGRYLGKNLETSADTGGDWRIGRFWRCLSIFVPKNMEDLVLFFQEYWRVFAFEYSRHVYVYIYICIISKRVMKRGKERERERAREVNEYTHIIYIYIW